MVACFVVHKGLVWLMLISMMWVVQSLETEDYLKYLPNVHFDSSTASTSELPLLFYSRKSPLERFQSLFQHELHLGNSKLRKLEEAIQYLDQIMGRQSKQEYTLNQTVSDNKNKGFNHQCNSINNNAGRPFYTTVFYGGGFISQFQSITKSLMYGLHQTQYSAPVIPIGVLHGYSTTQACDFADRSLFCYFQYLSPCQPFHSIKPFKGNPYEFMSTNTSQQRMPHLSTTDIEVVHSSENTTRDNNEQLEHRKLHLEDISILNSASYRYKPFHIEMIPKRFQAEGELFWWGAMQYYVFLLIHPKIFEQYILQDALQETPSFMEHYLPVRTGSSTTVSTAASSQFSRSRSGNTPVNHVPPPSSSSSGRSNNNRGSSHSNVVRNSFGGKNSNNAHLYRRHERGKTNPSFSFANNPLRNLLEIDSKIMNKPRNRIYPGGVVPPKQIKTTSIRKVSPHPVSTRINQDLTQDVSPKNMNGIQPQHLRGTDYNHLVPTHPNDDIIMPPSLNPSKPHPLSNANTHNREYIKNNNNSKPPRSPVSSSASSFLASISLLWETSTKGKTHRVLSSLSVLSLPRIGVHIRSRLTPTLDAPEKRPHIPVSLQMNFTHYSLNDVNQQLKRSFQVCPISVEIRTVHHPYIQCFVPIAFYPYSVYNTNDTNNNNNSNTSSNGNKIFIWQLLNWLQAALQEKTHFIHREQLYLYTAQLAMSGNNKTLDFTYEKNQQMYVSKDDIQEVLSMLSTLCPLNQTTPGNGKNVSCTLPDNQSLLTALNGTWLLPVDVFLATDDVKALQVARNRYHWVFFPPGISLVMNPEYTYKGTLFAPPVSTPSSSISATGKAPPSSASSNTTSKKSPVRRGHRNRQYHLQFKHIGAMLQSSTYVSYFAPYQVQATLEILRDVFYLSHACRVLIGSVSSHVMRASVGLGHVIGSVQEVYWLENEEKKRFWSEVLQRTTMPMPEVAQFA